MKITTTDNSVIIKDENNTIVGNVGSFGYTYNTLADDSITITKDGKTLMTGALSTSTVNDEALTATNIDEKMKPIFLNLKKDSDVVSGITEEKDPLFTEWKNGTSIIAGANANTRANGIAIGSNANARANGIAIGANAETANDKEIAFGSNNATNSSGSSTNKTHFSVASYNSTSNNKKNVIEARQNDDIYIYKDGTQIKLQDHLAKPSRKFIKVNDTKIKLDADADLVYIWDFNSNVPFKSFTMEEDAPTSTLNTTNSAKIVLKFTGSPSSSIMITLPKNLVYNTDADAKYYINTSSSGSEAGITSFYLKGNEMKVINIYGIGDKRIMEIGY